MKKIVLAFDSFKGASSAVEICGAAAVGIARVAPDADIVHCPLSDGGEGFAAALQRAGEGEALMLPVNGPRFALVETTVVFLDGGNTAVIESAQACGLHLLAPEQRTPWSTTTVGLGEMMAAAIAHGARRLIIGLGGSATNDAGMGMLTAFGWQFLDANDCPLSPIGASLGRVARIVPGASLDQIEIVAACDVHNPLYGPQGAAHVYGPQKGASAQEITELDAGLAHFAAVCAGLLGNDLATAPGAGAAGGLGFALIALLNASMRPGAELAIELTKLPDLLRGADLCLTGEGQTDYQTAYGKLPAAVAATCARANVPCVCLSGALGERWQDLYAHNGFTALLSIAQRPATLDEAIAATETNMGDAAEAVARILFSSHS